jgi:hypothetical protein
MIARVLGAALTGIFVELVYEHEHQSIATLCLVLALNLYRGDR